MRPLVLTLVALFVAALNVSQQTWAEDKKADADEKYTIKVVRFPGKGKSIKVSEKSAMVSVVKITDDNGNVVMDRKTSKSSLRVFVEKTLDVDEKATKRKKYSRKYEKARDVEGDESENKPYQGRTIVFEKSDGDWKLTAEGNPELGASDLKDLAEDAQRSGKSDDALYPAKAVKVGGKWTLNGKDVAKLFDTLKMNPDTVKGEGKLVKAYKKNGKQWGIIEYVITFESDLGVIKKAKGEMTATIDQPIDASSAATRGTFKVNWAGKQTIEQNCMKLGVDFKIDLTVSSEHTDEK